MKTIGIVAEYNPFHQGHQYLIRQAKKITGADRVVVIMSGNSVQRGDFAIVDEFARAGEAIHNGADLVLELSFCYASQSAEYFAKGAISILNHLGIVDYLCFGSEHNDSEGLKNIARLLADHSVEIYRLTQKIMKEGVSFPVARQRAVQVLQNEEVDYKIMSAPNDILGIEYIKTLYQLKSNIEPVSIQRRGADHHDMDFENGTPSASAIRSMVLENRFFALKKNVLDCDSKAFEKELTKLREFEQRALESVMPKSMAEYLMEKKREDSLVSIENYLDEIKAIVISRREQLGQIFEITEGIENLLQKKVNEADTVYDLAMSIKSKRFTYTRLRRILLNTLVGLTKEDMNIVRTSSEVPCSRILAFNDQGRQMLREIKIKNKDNDFIINKLADFKPQNELHQIQRKYDNIVDELFYLKYNYQVNGNRIYVNMRTSPRYIKNMSGE